ncbi:MAG: hypothetical protein Q7R78_02750 [bacterium]|nr:hypothetical protein [bacterium]
MSKKNILDAIILHHLQTNGVGIAVDTNMIRKHVMAYDKVSSNLTISLLFVLLYVIFVGFLKIPNFSFTGYMTTSQSIDLSLVSTAVILSVSFFLRALIMNRRYLRVLRWGNTTGKYAHEMQCSATIIANIFAFEKEFGKSPLVLGQEGTEKKFVMISVRIITLNDYEPRDAITLEKEEIFGRVLARMRTSAERLFPLKSEKEILTLALRLRALVLTHFGSESIFL